MTLIFTDSHLAISKKLGWDAMPAIVAIEAIDHIIDIAYAQVMQYRDHVSREEKAFSMLSDYWTSDAIFCMLIDTERGTLRRRNRELFLSLRAEIEEEMKRGLSYQEAINEWFKIIK